MSSRLRSLRTGLVSANKKLKSTTGFGRNVVGSAVAAVLSSHISLAAIRFLLSSVVIAVLLTPLSQGQTSTLTDDGWPRSITGNGYQLEIYQPQVDKWQGGKLEGRAAVVVERDGATEPTYGVVWLSARTTIDQDSRVVTLYQIQVTNARFPSPTNDESTLVNLVKSNLSQGMQTIALDRLLADLAIEQNEEKTGSEPLNTTTPKIYVRQHPAVLIMIDGKPVLRQVEGTGLLRVINSPAVIALENGSGNYFVQGDGYWMTGKSLDGPWILAPNPPSSLASVAQTEEQTPGKNTTAPKSTGAPPEIIVSTEPAELIQLAGAAEFSPIENTQLLYVTNTDNDLFMSLPQQRYYVLLSGRWFSSQSLDGPWSFIAGANLPSDFARIPPSHPKAEVLASVPGTESAKDAVLAAQVPQTATVDRKQATFSTNYDGAPQFRPIVGTEMSYAVNSPDDIILLRGKYYAVSSGVWFVANTPDGPWAVADFVPPDIYTIPPTSPLYHVRYVYVYDSTPDYVYVGYTPGYLGEYVWGGSVVYGTGFYYPCWAGSYYYGWPWTWGFGFHYAYWGGGFFWRPWRTGWGPWYHWGGWDRGHFFWHDRVLYNYPARAAGGLRDLHGLNAYDHWDRSVVRSREPFLTHLKAGTHPFERSGGVSPRPSAGSRPDLYAGRDGRVYENRNGQWLVHNGQRMNPVEPRSGAIAPEHEDRTTSIAPRPDMQNLEHDHQARITGGNRANQFHGVMGGGMSHGFGGFHPGGRH